MNYQKLGGRVLFWFNYCPVNCLLLSLAVKQICLALLNFLITCSNLICVVWKAHALLLATRTITQGARVVNEIGFFISENRWVFFIHSLEIWILTHFLKYMSSESVQLLEMASSFLVPLQLVNL